MKRVVALYEQRLSSAFARVRGTGFAASYPIKSLQRTDKYYMVMATGHPKAAILASNIVCGVEETYQREADEYAENQRLGRTKQPRLGLLIDPTPDEILASKVEELKEDIWEACRGKTLSREAAMMEVWRKWFGRVKGTHVTQALKHLINEKRATIISGTPGSDDAVIRFSA